MAYKCPRCGENVQRGSSTGAYVAGGLVGAMLVAAFGSFNCKACGKIKRSEFTPEDRNKMLMGSIGLIVGAVVVLVALVALLIALGD